MVHLQLIFPILHPSGLSCGSVPQWHHCLLIALPRLRPSSELFLLVTLWWLPDVSFCFKAYLFLLLSASLYPGSWVASRLDYFIFKTFFVLEQVNTYAHFSCLLSSVHVCSVGAMRPEPSDFEGSALDLPGGDPASAVHLSQFLWGFLLVFCPCQY